MLENSHKQRHLIHNYTCLMYIFFERKILKICDILQKSILSKYQKMQLSFLIFDVIFDIFLF